MRCTYGVLWASLWPVSFLALNAAAAPLPHQPVKGVATPISVSRNGAKPAFVLEASPTVISMKQGTSGGKLTVAAFAQNGFKGTIAVTITGTPTGVKVSPSSFTIAAGTLKEVTLSASYVAKPGISTLSLKGTSGALTGTASFSVKVIRAMTSASVSSTFFDFGNDLVNQALIHTVSVVDRKSVV